MIYHQIMKKKKEGIKSNFGDNGGDVHSNYKIKRIIYNQEIKCSGDKKNQDTRMIDKMFNQVMRRQRMIYNQIRTMKKKVQSNYDDDTG